MPVVLVDKYLLTDWSEPHCLLSFRSVRCNCSCQQLLKHTHKFTHAPAARNYRKKLPSNSEKILLSETEKKVPSNFVKILPSISQKKVLDFYRFAAVKIQDNL